jgi:hypothetical protein
MVRGIRHGVVKGVVRRPQVAGPAGSHPPVLRAATRRSCGQPPVRPAGSHPQSAMVGHDRPQRFFRVSVDHVDHDRKISHLVDAMIRQTPNG